MDFNSANSPSAGSGLSIFKTTSNGTDLMDYSMIDTTNTTFNYDLVSISPPNRSSLLNDSNVARMRPSTANYNHRLTIDTSDPADFCRTATNSSSIPIPSIYPSLNEFKSSSKAFRSGLDTTSNATTTNLDDDIGFYLTNRNSIIEDQFLTEASKVNDKDVAGSTGIELDAVKHKISSFWNNVKYGWSNYLKRSKITLDSNLPIYILGKSFANENYKQIKKTNDDPGMTSFYDFLDKSNDEEEYDDVDAPREMPIYSVKDTSDNFSINSSSYIFPFNRLSPKTPTTLNNLFMNLNTNNLKLPSPSNNNRLDSTYLIVDDDKQQQQQQQTPKQQSIFTNQPQKLQKTNSSYFYQNLVNENMKTSLDQEIYSRIWFTYRKDFEPLKGNPKYTSDCGWGCMLRSAQMLVAQGLLMHFFKNRWSLYSSLKSESDLAMYKQILVWFNDRPSIDCPFGIHRLLEIADSKTFDNSNSNTNSLSNNDDTLKTRVGTWFGPTSVCLLMKDAINEAYEANPLLKQLRIYCAQDCTIYKQDVIDLCTVKDEITNEEKFLACIILVSVRLGGEDLNEIYTPSLQRFLSMNNCIGLIGGKPKHSLYFIGYQGDNVIYLDPHISQPTVPLYNSSIKSLYSESNSQQLPQQFSLTHSYIDAAMSSDSMFSNTSYHCASPNKTSFSKLDPSLAIGFYCPTLKDLNELCDFVHSMSVSDESYPIFGISNDSFEKAHKNFQIYCEDDSTSLDHKSTKNNVPKSNSISIDSPGKKRDKIISSGNKLSNYLQTLPSLSNNSLGSRIQNTLTNKFMNNDQRGPRSLSNDKSSSSKSSKNRTKKDHDKDDFVLI